MRTLQVWSNLPPQPREGHHGTALTIIYVAECPERAAEVSQCPSPSIPHLWGTMRGS